MTGDLADPKNSLRVGCHMASHHMGPSKKAQASVNALSFTLENIFIMVKYRQYNQNFLSSFFKKPPIPFSSFSARLPIFELGGFVVPSW